MTDRFSRNMTYYDALDIEEMVSDYVGQMRTADMGYESYITSNGLEATIEYQGDHVYRLGIHGDEMFNIYFDRIEIDVCADTLEIEGFMTLGDCEYTTAFASINLDEGLQRGRRS